MRSDAVVLLRDDDGTGKRRQGLEQARTAVKIGVPIVIGLARTKRECWVLAGFDPQNAQEQERLERVKQRLGFDPRTCSERLTAHSTAGAKRDAKRVLDDLTGGDHDRQAECWRRADLAILESRGQRSGLTEYLSEVRLHLLGLFEGRRDRS